MQASPGAPGELAAWRQTSDLMLGNEAYLSKNAIADPILYHIVLTLRRWKTIREELSNASAESQIPQLIPNP